MVAALLFGTPLAACQASGPQPTVLAEKSPAGMEQMDILVRAANRAPHPIRVEVARTMEEQQRGMMFRESMGADNGMLFLYEEPQPVAYWMHNTVLPLDIIYVGPDRRVIRIAADAVPYSDEPIPSGGPVSAVLELNAGRAAQLGIAVGTQIDWPG